MGGEHKQPAYESSAQAERPSAPGEAYVSARPAERIPVLEFLGADGLPGMPSTAKQHVSVARALGRLQSRTRHALGAVTPADLFTKKREN